MINATISATRAAWYAVYEPWMLGNFRRHWKVFDNWWQEGSPLVTVYVPTHNRSDLLITRALASVLAQTYNRIEIIVAAHGCTDGTLRYLRDMNNPYIRVLEVPRTRTYPPTPENHWFAGPVVPCNAALKAMRGAWCLRLDDDDVLAPDAIERLLRFAQEGDYEYVSAAHETHEGKVAPYVMNGQDIGGIQTTLYRNYLKFFRYNRDCWRKKTDKVNDTDLQRRMVNAGVRTGYMPEIVCKILPRPGETEVGSRAYTAKVMEGMAF